MKKSISILLLFLVCLSVEAQKKNNKITDDVYATKEEKPSAEGQSQVTNNFLIEENKVIWQKVFETPLSFRDVVEKVKESGAMTSMEEGDTKIIGDLKPLPADFKGAGYTMMNTAIIVTSSDLLGYVLVEYKDNRYRVTIKNIQLSQKYDDPLSEMGQKTSIEVYAIKKGEFKNSFLNSISKILDYTFTKTFSVKKSNDNW